MLVKRLVPFYFCSFPVSKFFMFKQNDQKKHISIQAFKIMFDIKCKAKDTVPMKE